MSYYKCNTKIAVFIGIPNITKNYNINLIYSIDRGEFYGYKTLMLTPPFLVNLLAFKLRRVRRKRRLLPKKHHRGKFLGYNILSDDALLYVRPARNVIHYVQHNIFQYSS